MTEGTLPDAADIRFRHDGPAGLLGLATTLADGTEITARAESLKGFYVDVRTGLPIGRDFGGQMVLDPAALRLALATQPEAEGKDLPKGKAAVDEDEPKLCPAPTPDTAHNPKEHVLDYEDDVHRRVNRLLPIPRGFSVQIVDPETGDIQYPDDCFRYAGDLVDGDMQRGDFADAKGEEYDNLLKKKGIGGSVMKQLMDVSRRHLRAAEALGRHLKIYFAEADAAAMVRERFDEDRDLRRIRIGFLPPSKPKPRKTRSK